MALFSFDFDKVLTEAPQRYRSLIAELQRDGSEAMVISGSGSAGRIESFLRQHDYPEMRVEVKGASVRDTPEWKGERLNDLGVAMHIDDDNRVQSFTRTPVFSPSSRTRFGRIG